MHRNCNRQQQLCNICKYITVNHCIIRNKLQVSINLTPFSRKLSTDWLSSQFYGCFDAPKLKLKSQLTASGCRPGKKKKKKYKYSKGNKYTKVGFLIMLSSPTTVFLVFLVWLYHKNVGVMRISSQCALL